MIGDKGFCPGSKLLREPMPEDITCQECRGSVEIWTHELKATCPNCGATVFRERAPSCIDWCRFAEECIGPELYAQIKGVEKKEP